MKVLVIGGSGLIGGDAALHLAQQGHDVTIMSRKPPQAPALAALPFLAGDYINDDLGDGRLQGFDALVFATSPLRDIASAGLATPTSRAGGKVDFSPVFDFGGGGSAYSSPAVQKMPLI